MSDAERLREAIGLKKGDKVTLGDVHRAMSGKKNRRLSDYMKSAKNWRRTK